MSIKTEIILVVGMIFLTVLALLGIGVGLFNYIERQSQAVQFKAQMDNMNKSWMDSNQLVIEELKLRQTIEAVKDNEVSIIQNTNDACSNVMLPKPVIRVLINSPFSYSGDIQQLSNQSDSN